MAASDEHLVKRNCKYCDKNVTKKAVQCAKCDLIFHPSCANRVKLCCDTELTLKPSSCEVSEDDGIHKETAEERFLREENKLLKQQIKDKNTIISDKEYIIKILHEKIAAIEQTAKNNNKVKQNSINSKEDTTKNETTKNVNSARNMNAIQKQSASTSKEVSNENNTQELYSQTREKQQIIMEEVINLAISPKNYGQKSKQTTITNEIGDTEKGFIKVSRKSQRRKFGYVGKSDEEANTDFSGSAQTSKERKLWIFLKKVKDTANVDIIKKYLSEKLGTSTEDVSVRKVDTYHVTKDNNCYLIGVPIAHRQVVYDVDTWPRGVVFDRFNFRKGDKFLGSSKQDFVTA